MNRFAPWLAVAVSMLALVLAGLPLARRRGAEATPETSAVNNTPIAVPQSPGTAGTPASSLSNAEIASVAAEIVAKRERDIVDRIWPKIALMREVAGLSVPAKPAKLDEALLHLLNLDGGDDEVADGRSPEMKKQVTRCKNDLKQLGIYFCLYEAKFKIYPGSIDELKRPDMITADSTILVCPFDMSGDACSYEYLHPVRGDGEPGDSIMAYDRRLHPDGKRCVLYFQGRVEEVSEADFQKVLGEQIANDRANLADEVVKARAAALEAGVNGPNKEMLLKRLSILEAVQR
ncbi:MAG: hypothetical protein AAB074_12105 [Planctomycetota bacterium]